MSDPCNHECHNCPFVVDPQDPYRHVCVKCGREHTFRDFNPTLLLLVAIATLITLLLFSHPEPSPEPSPEPNASNNLQQLVPPAFAAEPSIIDGSIPQKALLYQSIEPEEALNLVRQWLTAKHQIFAPPFDRKLAAKLTTGKLFADITKPHGSIDWLQRHNAYYQFLLQQTSEPLSPKFVAKQNSAVLDVVVTEYRRLYVNNRLKTAYETVQRRYYLRRVGREWKIADSKVVR